MTHLESVPPRKRLDLLTRDVDGEVVIVDLSVGRVHQLNRTASVIWAGCDGKTTAAELVESLIQRFDVDQSTAAVDVTAAMAELQRLGLFSRAA